MCIIHVNKELDVQNTKPKIGIIVGSNRPTRVCLTVAKWVKRSMNTEALDFELIDLAEVNLPFLDEPEVPAHGKYQNDHTKAWSEKIKGYDGFVLVFPQYNWGYPAVLKNALDYLYVQATLAMKLVTQGLRMYNMSTNPPLDIDDEMFDEGGQFKDIDAAFRRYQQPMRAVADEFIDLLSK
jgi:hypothetical protein